jgi:hypothetical protein
LRSEFQLRAFSRGFLCGNFCKLLNISVTGGNSSAKETHHVWTLKGGDGMTQKFRIKLPQFPAGVEKHIGGVFTLGDTPVVAQAGHGGCNFSG